MNYGYEAVHASFSLKSFQSKSDGSPFEKRALCREWRLVNVVYVSHLQRAWAFTTHWPLVIIMEYLTPLNFRLVVGETGAG